MRERRVSVGLELNALRTEHVFQANLISVLADQLYLPPETRDVLKSLTRLHSEVAAWAASQGMPTEFFQPPAGSSEQPSPPEPSRGPGRSVTP